MKNVCVRMANDDEIQNWDKLLATNPDGGDVLQTKTMTTIKHAQGWASEYWIYETDFGKVYATVLARNLRGFGRLCYMMRGPGVINADQFKQIVKLNQTWDKKSFAIKMEPPITDTVKSSEKLVKVRNIQPNAHTILVNLSPNEDEILASFRQRARREIRAAEKDGVTARKVGFNQETIDQMFDLYEQTGKRAGFFIRPKSYYKNFWQQFHDAGEGDLYFAYAKDDKQPIAGAFICKLGSKALYKDGGSGRSGAKHFAHLLQWEIMKDLKSQGITQYDLHGVPPADQLDNKNHPLAGLAMFKMSFSQNVTDYVGAFDQILKPSVYKKWIRFGQRLHQAWAHRIKKTTLY